MHRTMSEYSSVEVVLTCFFPSQAHHVQQPSVPSSPISSAPSPPHLSVASAPTNGNRHASRASAILRYITRTEPEPKPTRLTPQLDTSKFLE
ncbi:hypothetical protein K432DRAFT_384585 [Lepidopterella palustris CBS 459.81]|uniref:Uncharacterized protein n=1 Tax=Lepidopterella palustris CBS 459.81 TaxID=1314670 RepID=A0A8E2JCN6_9PEZI|nr:hypothetical protein K432DRAFT_384585 [Lepidopterella palustris CBS 459.81]